MSKSPGSAKRVDKRSKHTGKKHTDKKQADKKHADNKHRSLDRHKENKRSSMQLPGQGSSSGAGPSSSGSHVYTEPGPHQSTFVRAIHGSPFLYARGGSYAIREGAYVKEVFDASGEQTVVMNCRLSKGVLIRPKIRQAKFEYPDGSFMHCVPVCDVRVVSMRSVYRLGRGREFINSESEVYGRDSVLLQMRTRVLNKLKKQASRVYSSEFENDRIYALGEPDEKNEEVSVVPCSVRRNAKVIGEVRGKVFEKGVARIAGGENKDIDGDVLIALKYIRNPDKHTAEIVFEVQDVLVRRGAERLFSGAGSSS